MATQVLDTRQVLDHHLRALADGRVDEILDDYVEDSVLIVADGPIKGRDGIRSAFEGFVSGLFKPGTYDFTMDTLHVAGDAAYVIWHAKCASVDVVFATDTFIVKDGKIAVQTFAAKIEPRS
jgi:ketosteroid isomerase-like protein